MTSASICRLGRQQNDPYQEFVYRMQSESEPGNERPASLDALDHQLLALLRVDARTATATLARKLGVSRGTVANRIARLEDTGVIVGYMVQVRPDSKPSEIRAWMSIAVEGDKTREVIKRLLGEPSVSSLHDTNGRWDLLAEVHAASITELSEVLERIRKIKGIGNSETSIHLQTFRLT
jgi:DNA-binding Lrp family transcriptional regulator